MKSLNIRIALALVACVCTTNIFAQQPLYDVPTDPFARDLVILTDWFEGDFDNEEQVWYQADSRSKTHEEDRHVRLHTMHRRLHLPDFGEHVFYVEEYKNNDVDDLVRQRFVIFTSEGLDGGIRMQQGFFKDAASARGAQIDPNKLSGLTKDDVFFLNECDVYWRRNADQFEGQMRPKSCVFGEGEKRRYSVHNMVLSADKYWRVDSTRLLSDDSLHVGHAEDNPTQMRRANPFICEVSFRLADGSSQKEEGLRLHSQGGSQTVARQDNGEEYVIRLRDKEYPFYNTRPDFLFLTIRKASEQRSQAYVVTDTNARRVAVNAGGVLVQCFRDGYTFRQTLDQL